MISCEEEKEHERSPLMKSSMRQNEDMNISELITESLRTESAQHAKVLESCLSSMRNTVFLGFILALDYRMRSNVLVLYARTLDDCPDTLYLSIVIYGSYFISGFFSLINGIIGDQWRFDYLLCFAAFLDVITFWLEATATNFITLAVVCDKLNLSQHFLHVDCLFDLNKPIKLNLIVIV